MSMIDPKNINDETGETAGKNDISVLEKDLLDNASDGNDIDSQQLKRAQLDSTDIDGTPLNEEAGDEDLVGDDLDIPGIELDDADEEIGEEDEENNSYSQADTD